MIRTHVGYWARYALDNPKKIAPAALLGPLHLREPQKNRACGAVGAAPPQTRGRLKCQFTHLLGDHDLSRSHGLNFYALTENGPFI